ncbi:hypothetical protein GCM10009792_19660 [Microcella alkalica]|uniref:DUF3618 domain-containing protein n=1 Tax=Microcella alkalica TaxID=355930 RepID=A0A839EA36_9MICO|nr:DUF3618 domain-containing protein [Microcella alkalica]MBA8848610.1 hypothetical protein [Microcella alkalica]
MTDSTNPTGTTPTTPYTAPASTAPVGFDPTALENAKTVVTDSVEATRLKLEQTLDAIEDKFDVKKRTDEVAERVQRSYEENPVPWIIGATAVAVGVIGLVAWAIFSDD